MEQKKKKKQKTNVHNNEWCLNSDLFVCVFGWYLAGCLSLVWFAGMSMMMTHIQHEQHSYENTLLVLFYTHHYNKHSAQHKYGDSYGFACVDIWSAPQMLGVYVWFTFITLMDQIKGSESGWHHFGGDVFFVCHSYANGIYYVMVYVCSR